MTIIGETHKGREHIRAHFSDIFDNGYGVVGIRRALEHLDDLVKEMRAAGLEVDVK